MTTAAAVPTRPQLAIDLLKAADDYGARPQDDVTMPQCQAPGCLDTVSPFHGGNFCGYHRPGATPELPSQCAESRHVVAKARREADRAAARGDHEWAARRRRYANIADSKLITPAGAGYGI